MSTPTPVLSLLGSRFFPHPFNDGTFAYKKSNGKILCVTPTGGVEERDSPGPWESFSYKKGDTFCVANRGDDNIYLLPVAP